MIDRVDGSGVELNPCGGNNMLANLPITTTDLLVMGGTLVVFLALSVLVFFRRGN